MRANLKDPRLDAASDSPFAREAFEAEKRPEERASGLDVSTPWATAFAGESAPQPQFDIGVIGDDDRKRITPSIAVPWRWMCHIEIRDTKDRPEPGGSGLLVSDRHVLTAAHVVWAACQDPQLHAVTVRPGYDYDKEPFGSTVASKIRVCPKYDPTKSDADEWDYALITLHSAIGRETFDSIDHQNLGFWGDGRDGDAFVFGPGDPGLLQKATARTAGYPGDKGYGRELWCASGTLRSIGTKRTPYLMWTTADMTPGQSGSPLWVESGNQRVVVGVAVLAGTVNNAVRRVTPEMLKDVRGWIAKDGEKATLPEPTGTPQAAPSHEFGEGSEAVSQAARSRPAREAEESNYVGAGPREEFDLPAIPKDVAEALDAKDWTLALKRAIDAGWRNPNDLTDLIFFARHSELAQSTLDAKDPNYKKLSAEWSNVLEQEVWKAIQAASENMALAVSGTEVADHDKFFWGPNGKRFQQLVEEKAKEVDLNPGLLGTIMMAETRDPLSYLSSDKVNSYYIGTDDFYEGRAAIAQRVPAYSKVGWDKNQVPWVHMNDATTPREVKSIMFNSGRDAALAIAVYIKFREVRLREIAGELGGNFDTLPVEIRFALTRMAMAAGTAGTTRFLKDALAGKDILVRKNIPVKIYQTQRNATVRAAQALHLSDWIFGIKLQSASQQVKETTETVDPEISGETVGSHADEAADLEESVGTAGEEPLEFQLDTPGPTILKAVGERVELDVGASAYASSYEKVKWTIPGRFVQGYDGTARDAKLFELQGSDLERPKISFFWVDAGTGRTVRAKITAKDGTEHEWATVFDVEGPTVDVFTAEVGETQIGERSGLREMRFGKPLKAPGVRWCWKVTMPAKHAGRIKDVQTALSDRTRVETSGADLKDTRKMVWRHPKKRNLHVQLDGSDDGQAVYSAGLLESSIEAGKSFANGFRGNEDSPGTELPGVAKTVSVNEQFNYYLMFKPETEKPFNAIWVPIAKAKWSWKSVATQSGGRWTVKPEKMKPAIEKTTLEFPMYETNLAENEWLDETELKSGP